VHKGLRAEGLLLIVQPAPVDPIIHLEIGGRIEVDEELNEPNFNRYLEATEVSIHNVISEHLFVLEDEATIPEEDLFHTVEYDSIDEWVDDCRLTCEDLMPFDTLVARMRDVAGRRKHKVIRYWKEHRVLLRKLEMQN
jgi:hypothetical protein